MEVEDGNLIELSTPHCFVLRTEDEDLYFCVESSEELQTWISELQWRIQATQRTIKYRRANLESDSDNKQTKIEISQSKSSKK